LGYLTNVNGTLFFSANDGNSGHELWKSDGTEAGTIIVKDINLNGQSSSPDSMTNFNGTLFFSAYDSSYGEELWKSDGTEAGTVLVKDINPLTTCDWMGSPGSGSLPCSSSPSSLTNVNGTLFFSADDGSSGEELWKSDGTEAGTELVKDINPSDSSWPEHLTNVNGTLFFRADDGSNGWELWKSDGAAAGTELVKDVNTSDSSTPMFLTNVNGTLFFGADDGSSGYELWKSDGTAAGTVRVKDINSGVGSSLASFPASDGPYFANINGTLFFVADDGSSGYELWKSDGTEAGTVLVKDISPSGSWYPKFLTNLNGTLFFNAYDSSSGYELWKSDGTQTGTVLVKDVTSGSLAPMYLTPVNDTLFFSAYRNGGRKLWKSDGTEAGTVLVKNITPGTSFGLAEEDPSLTNVNGVLFLSASDGSQGYELWTSNGTDAGTVLVKDIKPGGGSSSPYSLIDVNGKLFFGADDGSNGTELWACEVPASGWPSDSTSYLPIILKN
jgi:ELWxxDGT repeat protein